MTKRVVETRQGVVMPLQPGQNASPGDMQGCIGAVMRQRGVGHGKAFGVKIVLVQHPDKLVLRCHVGDFKGDRAGGVLLHHGGVTSLGRRTNSVCQDTNMIGGKRQSGRKCRRRNAE